MGSIFSDTGTKNAVSSSHEPQSDIDADSPVTSPQSHKSNHNEANSDSEDEFINHGQLHFEQTRSQWLTPHPKTEQGNDDKRENVEAQTERQNKENSIGNNDTKNNDSNKNENKNQNENKNDLDLLGWYDIDDEQLPQVYKHFFEETNFERAIPLESMIEVMRKLWFQEEQAGYEFTQASQANSALSLDRLQ